VEKLRVAKIVLACGLLSSIVSASATEDSGTVSTHRYNDYRRYGSGPVANYFSDEPHEHRPVHLIARTQNRTLHSSQAAQQLARHDYSLGCRHCGTDAHL
jgi:hypothetical protein